MKVAKALKEKNKLLKEIGKLRNRVEQYNSLLKGNPVVYDTKSLLKELQEKTEQLVQLKSAVSYTNIPVQEKIFRLAELKALLKFYRNIPVKQGKAHERYGLMREQNVLEYESQVKAADVDALAEQAEKEVEALQDELDAFNHTTELAM